MDEKKMKELETKLRKQFMEKFSKKSMGAEEGHPDLLQKLENKFK